MNLIFSTMSNRILFQKPYTSAHDLVRLLQSRGLAVTDKRLSNTSSL